MNPKLVACMFFSVLVGGVCAGAALSAGWGLIAGLGVYSLAGSATLVPGAIWAAFDPEPRSSVSRAKGRKAVVA